MADAPTKGQVTQKTRSISWDPAKCAFELTLMGIELEPGVEYEIQTTVLSPDKKPQQQPVIQKMKAEQR